MSRRTALLGTLALLCALSLGVEDTTASFGAAITRSSSGVATDSLAAPTGLVVTPIGDDVQVTWAGGALTSGSAGVGHRVLTGSLGVEPGVRDGQDVPTGCTDAAALSELTRLAVGTTTATHAGASTATVAGSWRCYRVEAEVPATPATASWSSVTGNPFAAIQIGHVVTSVELVDGGTPGALRSGDAFVVRFTQPVDVATGPVSTPLSGAKPRSGNDICIDSTNDVVVLGRDEAELNSSCNVAHGNLVGRLDGVTLAPDWQLSTYRATYAWSDCASPQSCSTLTATLGALYRGADVTISANPSTVFAPTTTPGALTTDTGTVLCSATNSGARTCQPTPFGAM